jgi:hypothetical protein
MEATRRRIFIGPGIFRQLEELRVNSKSFV